jgi:adenylate cyclase
MRIERSFGFVDLCGFTAFTERYGDEHTVVVLTAFRRDLREIAARRGVRLAKWLGDGAMLSSGDTEALVAMVVEVAARNHPVAVPLPVRAGLAEGAVILFEGDDYIGRAANVASRLCDAARPGEVLCTREVSDRAPRWVTSADCAAHDLPGFDRPIDACRLAVGVAASGVLDPVCGLELPDIAGLATRFDAAGGVERFCSDACALAWEQRQRPGPLDQHAPAAPADGAISA